MPKGTLIVIAGCMFSGKTTKLIHFAQKALDEGKKIAIFYPEIDTRYKKDAITSHDAISIKAQALAVDAYELPITNEQVIFIDELQFFEKTVLSAIAQALDKGVDVILSGLDRNYRAEPFGVMPDVMRLADELIELKAKCHVCQKDAMYTYRVDGKKDDATIVIGGADTYEARCEQHYIKPQ